jgi:hypothetical protein
MLCIDKMNTLTDFLTPSLSFSKTEMFDINMAKYILSQPIDNEDKKKLKKMMKNKERGSYLNIHYVLGKASKQNKYGKEYLGRLVPMGNFGNQSLSGDIRRAITKPYYWDLDIVNAQGELLNQLAKKNGWTNTCLTELCKNRDEIFQQIMIETNKSRSDVKVIFLSLFFGGACYENYSKWIKEKFYPEIQAIMINLANQYPDLLNNCVKIKPTNPIGSCCAIILQTLERKCLLCLDTFLTMNGRSMDTFIHDGGLVLKLKDESEFPPELIKKGEEYLLENIGFDLKLVCKSMESTFELPVTVEEDKTYPAMKYEFEKKIFKCIDTSNFYFIENRKVKCFTKTDLITSYEHLKYKSIEDGMVVESSFIKKWLTDARIRTYKYVDTVIPPFECPDDTFNLWDGLEVENIPEEELSEDMLADIERRVDSIFAHIKFLCNNDEPSYQYVIACISFWIKYPALKNNIALIFKSKPGFGKSMTFTFFSNLIGTKYCTSIKKPERDVFGDFNGLVHNKVLICFEELNAKTGFKHEDDIKELITGERINITFKRDNTVDCLNYLRCLFFTNNDFPIKISLDDRRFFMVDCMFERPEKSYFDDLLISMNNKQVQKLFYEKLIEIETDKVDWIKDRPLTEVYEDMKEVSLDIEQRFIVSYFEDKYDLQSPFAISSKDFFEAFKSFIFEQGIEGYVFHNIKFGIKLKNYKIDGFSKTDGKITSIYHFDLSMLRAWLIRRGIMRDNSHVRLL